MKPIAVVVETGQAGWRATVQTAPCVMLVEGDLLFSEDAMATQRQRLMALHARAVAELRACQHVLRQTRPDVLELSTLLAFTGGSVLEVL